MAGMYGTNFTESEALLAVQEGDYGEANRLMSDMLPGERDRLGDAARKLAELCDVYVGQPGPAL